MVKEINIQAGLHRSLDRHMLEMEGGGILFDDNFHSSIKSMS